MKHIDVSKWVKSPDQLVCILWEIDNRSGRTICAAWQLQHEIDMFYKAGYNVIDVVPA